jgi:hypothetical protein
MGMVMNPWKCEGLSKYLEEVDNMMKDFATNLPDHGNLLAL